MATSWLDLQAKLKSGVKSFPNPVKGKCGTGTRTIDTDINLGLPGLDGIAGDLNGILGDVQGAIDQFGSEVMGVLQDIGAWIPPDLQGSGSSSAEAKQAAKIADITKQNTQTIEGGNIATTTGHNEQTGQSFYQIKMSSGTGMAFDTDGSIRFNAAADPPDSPIAGDFEISRCNSFLANIEESCIITVNNKNNICGGKDANIKKSLMILVNGGDVDLEVTGGDVKVKSSGNISLDAGKTLELRGADIKLLAGGGISDAKKAGQAAGEQYGGMIDLRCGTYRNSATTKQTIESAKYSTVKGELTIAMEDPMARFNIVSAGHFMVDVNGDILEESRSKATIVGRIPKVGIPALPILGNLISQNAQYTVVNDRPIIPEPSTGSTESPDAQPMMQVVNSVSAQGGFKVNLMRGDIIFSTKQGNLIMGNEKSLIADITKPNTDVSLSPAIVKGAKTPGMYVGSDASPFLALYNASSTYMTAGKFTPGPTPTINSVVVTPASVNLTATAMTNKVIGAMTNNLKGAVTTDIAGTNTLNIKGANIENITGAKLANVTGFITDKSPAGVVIESPGAITIRSIGIIDITSGDAINITAGGALTMIATAILLN
jgi:uncharacterized protein (DUF2345 family)